MAKKKKNNNNSNSGNDGNNKTDNDKKDKGGDGENISSKDDHTTTAVMKIEMHCEGCASKITKLARNLQGVETAKAETDTNKLTVIGKVDPLQIQEILQQKTKKKVDLISPQVKKQDPNKTNNNNKSTEKPQQSAKPKVASVTTAILKLEFHCHGCIERIHKIVSKTKGVQEMAVDKQKETVTVKGTMDAKALAEVLNEKLKRPVSIQPPKKEKEEGPKGGGNDGGGGKKNNGGGGGGGGGGPATMEGNRMDFMAQPGYGPGYGYMGQPVYGNGYMGQPVYGNGYAGQPVLLANGYMGQPVYGYGQEYGYGYGYGAVPGYPAHMKFNDENPNACSMM